MSTGDLTGIPTLDELARHPERVQLLPQHAIAVVIPQLLALQTALLTHCLTASMNVTERHVPEPTGRYLTVQEVVARFHVTPRWLYKHKKQLPHSQPSRKTLLFPEQGIQRWFERKRNS